MSKVSEVPSKRKKLSSGHVNSHSSPEKKATPSKSPFQRVFSEEDEIHLLNAFLEITKDSPNPATAAPLLYDRVGKSLTTGISQTQLIEKLRKLRQKYTKQVTENLSMKNPHEKEIFEISHKIWGENPSQVISKRSPKVPRSVKKKSEQKEVVEQPNDEETAKVEMIHDDFAVDLEKNYSFLMEEVTQFPGKSILKEGLNSLGMSKLGEFNENWRLQQIAEAEILVQKTELIQEQTKLMLEAVGSQIPN